LRDFKGADGIKTGYTNAAGFNLVASAERGNERIIATVFGGRSTKTRNQKIATLLNYGFKEAPTHAKVIEPRKPNYAISTRNTKLAVNSSLRPKARPEPKSENDTFTNLAALDLKEGVAEALTLAYLNTPSGIVKKGKEFSSREKEIIAATLKPKKLSPEVVTRISASGGRDWAINVGRFTTRFAAEKMLLKTALAEMSTLNGSLRKVVPDSKGFEANFVGLSEEAAERACKRLVARNVKCHTLGPS
jgi:D-alanyl-D-alanine carboxypeptidase